MVNKNDSTGPGRMDGTDGGSDGRYGVKNGASTGPGRKEGTGRDGNEGGRGTGSGKGKTGRR